MLKGFWRTLWATLLGALGALLVTIPAVAIFHEVQSSTLQARFFSDYAATLRYQTAEGPAAALRYPDSGPFNERLGYTRLARLSQRLPERGFALARQTSFSPALLDYVDSGGNPPYQEKLQAGLNILDSQGATLFASRHPERVYHDFEAIPPLLVDTLLFIENRDLLDPDFPLRNPAVEWPRLGKALAAHVVERFQPGQDTAGASTLATQLEKFRHSPEGLTSDPGEKFRQMLSASVRAYQDGPDTSAARRRIVRDYINTTPLAGRVGIGEVHGIGDGLWAWYGIEFDEANQWLGQAMGSEIAPAQAQVFKAALSLLLSQRRPSHYLLGGRNELLQLTNSYLRVLAAAGVISPALRDAALAQALDFRTGTPPATATAFNRLKAVNSVRTGLLSLLGVNSLYALDRLDLSVSSTIASQVQAAVEDTLQTLADPEQAQALGLIGPRLLAAEQLDAVRFSVVLYERTPAGNKLRVQSDNLNMPFDMNEGSKLDLGSTAKLRTLVTYLDVLETLYHRLSPAAEDQIPYEGELADDPLSQWTAGYLRDYPRASLQDLLDAAMQRRYSASPTEVFFTAGGQHRFGNFEASDNGKVLTVQEAFTRSVNLVFIRMMRDITRFYTSEIPGIAALLDDPDNPLRQDYLARFADQEGRVYLQRFHGVYRDKDAAALLATLAQRTRPTPYRLTMAFRSVQPEADIEALAAFLALRLPAEDLPSMADIQSLYQRYARDNYNSNDRAYLAGLNPLELWLVEYLLANPGASLQQAVTASTDERQVAYQWLFKTRSQSGQQRRIRTLVEQEAFAAIHRQWQQLGYPFPSLVPSYATALGVSADRPQALATLLGIIINDGVRLPMSQLEQLHFAADTPYETLYTASPEAGEAVLSPAVSRTVRRAMIEVVENGSGRRLNGVFRNATGEPVAVGGKTGTGDHRSREFGAGGVLLRETVVNRNAIFTFFIDDRFFGTILANVGGPKAREFDFTSGLAAQLLRALEPALRPLIHDCMSSALLDSCSNHSADIAVLAD